MTDAALVHRRRAAFRLLLLEAGMLAAILGAFAVISFWLAGGASSEAMILLGLGLMLGVLLAEWVLVRSQWKRLRDDYDGRGRAP